MIGAYLALFPSARLGVVLPLGLFLEFVRVPASLLIGLWALLQVVFAYSGPTFGAVAWPAHIAGFLFGVVFALLTRAARQNSPIAQNRLARILVEGLGVPADKIHGFKWHLIAKTAGNGDPDLDAQFAHALVAAVTSRRTGPTTAP